jgi:hypothetical protein
MPALIENEVIRIVIANVKRVVDAALFRAGRLQSPKEYDDAGFKK